MSRHLMAKFRTPDDRRSEFGFDFDWTPDAYMRNYTARLENGDEIEVRARVSGDTEDWNYQIRGPLRPTKKDVPKLERPWGTYHTTEGVRGVMAWEGAGDHRDGKRQVGWTDPKDAIRAAEAHYKGLKRRDVAPPTTRDYDINDIMNRFKGGEL